ncbi:hypothetical protein V6N11_080692 [Hibiscus sabdariffa]|uniref:Uncharacterized protein n=1 Tax=Hibiscus sabdariffa TaxID=183260 RepID=A0ABR2QI60_9ROSI
MISAKKLIELARKWQKLTAIKRKRITLSRTSAKVDTNSCSASSMVEKDHFVVYCSDENRNNIFCELLKMSEKEFGLPSGRPIAAHQILISINLMFGLKVKVEMLKEVVSLYLLAVAF